MPLTPSPLPPDDPARGLRALLGQGRFQETLLAWRLAGETPEAARPEVQLVAATAATRLGELATAMVLARGAMEGFWARADDDGRMRATNLLGVIAFEQGAMNEAERRLRDAWQLAQRLDDSLMAARAANNLASAAHLRGDPETALGLYRACLLSYQRLGDRRGMAEAYHNIALVFRKLGQLDEADAATDQAVRHAGMLGEDALVALARAGRAELRLVQREFALAEADLAVAWRHATRAGDAVGTADIARLRARLELERGNPEVALREAEGAAALAREQGGALMEAECDAAAALALRAGGRAAEAAARADRVRATFDRLNARALLLEFEADWARLGG